MQSIVGQNQGQDKTDLNWSLFSLYIKKHYDEFIPNWEDQRAIWMKKLWIKGANFMHTVQNTSGATYALTLNPIFLLWS